MSDLSLSSDNEKNEHAKKRVKKVKISAASIKRLARRGGVVRMEIDVSNYVRNTLRSRLRSVLQKAIIMTEYRGSKTMKLVDIKKSLELHGQTLYGFD
jgi:histone H3/H4